MKKSEVKDAVLEFIKTNPGVDLVAIKNGTDASDILARGAIKSLLEENLITTVGEGIYSLQSKSQQIIEAAEGKPGGKKVVASAAKKKEEDDLGPKTFTGRDNSKYRFGEHRNLPKGRLVLVLVRAYVEKKPNVSLSQLQDTFKSKEIQPRFGVVEDLKKAKAFSKNNVDRFFLKNDDLIKLANGTKIAVCTQWTSESIAKILKLASAQPLGFRVKVEEAAE
jgi:hypothetical protein